MLESHLSIIELVLGLLLCVVLAYLVSEFIAYVVRKYGTFTPPEGVDRARWENAFNSPCGVSQINRILGYGEVIFYFMVFLIKRPELIAGWLAFKVASKWQSWSTILKIPESVENLDPWDYIGAKNKVASHTLQRWFLGNLANIVAGAIVSICVCLGKNYLLTFLGLSIVTSLCSIIQGGNKSSENNNKSAKELDSTESKNFDYKAPENRPGRKGRFFWINTPCIDGIDVICTIAIAVATIFIAIVTRQNVVISDELAKISKSSLEMTAAENRPYIAIKLLSKIYQYPSMDKKTYIVIPFEIRNVGKLPALEIKAEYIGPRHENDIEPEDRMDHLLADHARSYAPHVYIGDIADNAQVNEFDTNLRISYKGVMSSVKYCSNVKITIRKEVKDGVTNYSMANSIFRLNCN